MALILTIVRVGYLVPYLTSVDKEVRRELSTFDRLQAPGIMLVTKDDSAADHPARGVWILPWYVEDLVVSLASTRTPIFVATSRAIPSQHLIVPAGSPYSDLYGWRLSNAIPVKSATQLGAVNK